MRGQTTPRRISAGEPVNLYLVRYSNGTQAQWVAASEDEARGFQAPHNVAFEDPSNIEVVSVTNLTALSDAPTEDRPVSGEWYRFTLERAERAEAKLAEVREAVHNFSMSISSTELAWRVRRIVDREGEQ